MPESNLFKPFDWYAQLTGPSGLRSALQSQAAGFWQVQGLLLSDLEELSRGWFKRRRDAADAASEAARAICASTDMASAMAAYQGWLIGSVSRMTTDVAEAQAAAMHVGQALLSAVQDTTIAIANAACEPPGQAEHQREPSRRKAA